MKSLLLPIFFILSMISLASAQTGQYEVRLEEYLKDVNNLHYYVDIQIKAANSTSTFVLYLQSYRFGFDNSVLANPVVDQAFLDDSGYATVHRSSSDSIVSYNLLSGTGTNIAMDEVTWVTMGRIRFDILDLNGVPNFNWKKREDFPSTVILERVNSDYFEVGATSFGDNTCFSGNCSTNYPPVSEDDGGVYPLDRPITIDVLANDSDPDAGDGLDPSTVSILVPSADATTTVNPDGTITVVPNAGFNGTLSFIYEACDINGPLCDEAEVFIEIFHAGDDKTICLDNVLSFPLEASGAGVWSNLNGMTFSDVNDPNTTVSDLLSGTWDFVWTVNAVSDTVTITITDGCVFPGDTNNDAEVNNYDVLNIGIANGTSGAARPNATTDWVGQASTSWNETTANGTDYKHIDADGNGLIDSTDADVIMQNWGESYTPVSNFQQQTGNIPFYVMPANVAPNSTLSLPIMLGDAANPIEDAYGLAFTMTYDTVLVKPETTQAFFNFSWLGTLGNDMIEVQQNFSKLGQIDIGLTRMDGFEMTGYGQIGVLYITIKDDIWGNNAIVNKGNVSLNIGIENVRLQNAEEVEILTNPLNSTIELIDFGLDAQVLLEGCYDSSNELMHDDLREDNLVAATEPFSQMDGYEFPIMDMIGLRMADSAAVLSQTGANAIVDWVFIEIRDKDNPALLLTTQPALLNRQGKIVGMNGQTPPQLVGITSGEYHVAIRHPNHIGIMTAEPVLLGNNSTTLDFRHHEPYNNGAKLLLNGFYALYAGDLDGNGVINSADRSTAWNERNSIGRFLSDGNMDGKVDSADRSIPWNNRNKFTQIP